MSTVNSNKLLSQNAVLAAAKAMWPLPSKQWDAMPLMFQRSVLRMARTGIKAAIRQSQKTADSRNKDDS